MKSIEPLADLIELFKETVVVDSGADKDLLKTIRSRAREARDHIEFGIAGVGELMCHATRDVENTGVPGKINDVAYLIQFLGETMSQLALIEHAADKILENHKGE